jgi:hypothetical protein
VPREAPRSTLGDDCLLLFGSERSIAVH